MVFAPKSYSLAMRTRAPNPRASTNGATPTPQRSVARAAGLALLMLALAACASRSTGPPFAFALEAPRDSGRVYVYRADPRGSLTRVKVTIDDRELGIFRDQEYETILVSPGEHRLRAEMRGLPYLPMGWNEHRFQIEPGETRFLQLEIRIESRQASPRSLEIGGRSNDVLAENVFIRERNRSDAERDLKATRRANSHE